MYSLKGQKIEMQIARAKVGELECSRDKNIKHGDRGSYIKGLGGRYVDDRFWEGEGRRGVWKGKASI